MIKVMVVDDEYAFADYAAPPAPPKVKVAAPTPVIIKTTQSGKVIP